MGYNLTKEEQETIINLNEAESTASVTTFNGVLIRKLVALCETRPNDASYKGPDQNGEYAFIVPKSWIKVNPSRIISDALKEAKVIHGKALGKARQASKQ